MRPILKWAGGKTQIINKILSLFPEEYENMRYHEPFFGGGAVFFHVEPTRGSINDVNLRLMNFYRVVKNFPEELILEGSKHRYSKEDYYRLRNVFNSSQNTEIEEAALFLYLNKTAYNGLYRVNSKGKFNVPFGRYVRPRIVPRKKILKASQILKNIEIYCGDFTDMMAYVKEGDLCYLDPPYHPSSGTADFTEYHHYGFSFQDQIRLKELCLDLDKKGVSFVLSNSDTPRIRKLYEKINGFRAITFKTKRLISSKTSSRSSGREVLITNCS